MDNSPPPNLKTHHLKPANLWITFPPNLNRPCLLPYKCLARQLKNCYNENIIIKRLTANNNAKPTTK